jgi:uncharacterized membrane-anchored protein
MNRSMRTDNRQPGDVFEAGRQMLRKVPEITLYFWVIKVLCTTVGESAADYLQLKLNLGLTYTTVTMSVLLAVILFLQVRARKYVPWVYWLAVVLLSVVGTLVTDNLTDHLGVSLVTTTVIFSVALIATFVAWYASEKTLSIHSIYTTKREAFYWLAILFTFALGTASGDLIAERFSVGYWHSALLFGAAIAAITIAHYVVRAVLNAEHRMQSPSAILAFWLVYILTRPLGASVGDYLSQGRDDGGLALGATVTSALFLAAILVTVVYLTVTKKDVIRTPPADHSLPVADAVVPVLEVEPIEESQDE